MLDDVRPYLEIGWPVHPMHTIDTNGGCTCRKGDACEMRDRGKHPRTMKGVGSATLDLDQWKAWERQYSGRYNPALACGLPSGVVALDVDKKDGGLEELERLLTLFGALPRTPVAESGSGGLHYYFKMHPDVPTSKDSLGKGIETKSTGSSIHLPPSKNVNGAYRWLVSPFTQPLAPLPDWIVEHFRRREEARREGTKVTGSGPYDMQAARMRAERWVASAEPAIAGHGGHVKTFKIALGLVRGFLLPVDVAFDVMSAWNHGCQPPWSPKDLMHKLESAASKSRTEPGYLYYADRKPMRRRQEQEAADDDEPAAREPLPVVGIEAPPKDLPRVLDVFPDCPATPTATVPFGWSLREDGLFRQDMEDGGAWKRVASDPLIITAVLKDGADGTTYMRLAHRTRDPHGYPVWQTKLVNAEVIASHRKIEGLARYDVKVNSANAKGVVAFLQAYVAHNKTFIPRALAARHLGWQTNGGFFWGERLIVKGEVVMADDADLAKWGRYATVFADAEASLAEMASCYVGSGSLATWRTAVGALAANSPHLKLAIVASFAAPLLELAARIGRPCGNFCVDFANTTSTGKTTLLRLAASAWGNPFDNADSTGLVASWGATKSFIERLATIRNHMPIFLDDTKRARQGVASEVVYMIANGQGDGRASITGVQERRRFRTILLSTGEGRLVDFSEDGGARGRTLQLWGPPFGKPSTETAIAITAAMETVTKHHGIAGPMFIKWVTEHYEKIPSWVDVLDTLEKKWMSRSASGALFRQSRYFAILELAERLLSKSQIIPWTIGDKTVIDETFDMFAEASTGADRSTDAFAVLREFCAANRHRFFDITQANADPPSQGWFGRWDTVDMSKPGRKNNIAVFRHVVEETLGRAKFDAKATIRTWVDSKLISADEKQSTKVVSIGGTATRALCFDVNVWMQEEVKDVMREVEEATGVRKQLVATQEGLFGGGDLPPVDTYEADIAFSYADEMSPSEWLSAAEDEILNPRKIDDETIARVVSTDPEQGKFIFDLESSE